MRVTYLKLENVSGLWVGSERSYIEISFEKSRNRIVSIQGANGVGKTVLISSISPFATVTALDERSSLSYIIPKKQGYKEIHYQDGENTYIIKHYYKPKENTHSVKSYFMMNGEELNENGNVKSFLALVEIHMGLTQEMMRLIRLGTNVNSFITLTPALRKEYIGRLIEEIDMYIQVYRKVNKDMIVTKSLLNANNQSMYNCHISDEVVEHNRLRDLEASIAQYSQERDKLIGEISRIDGLMRDNNVEELRRRAREAQAALEEFERTEQTIREQHLQNTTVEQLIKERARLSDERGETQGKVNAYRISIDNTLRLIERLEMNVKRITSNNDVQSLMTAIADLKTSVEGTSKVIVNFQPLGSSSEEVMDLLTQLKSFNQISQMIYTFGNRPVEVYLRLRAEKRSVDKFLKEQAKKRSLGFSEADMKHLMDQVFGDDSIIMPNCDTEYKECPYYRLSETINNMKARIEEDTYDDETLRYIQVIANNIDNILNELDRSMRVRIPDKVRSALSERVLLSRMDSKLPFFDLSDLQDYLTILREWEQYCQSLERLKQYEAQLAVYKKSGIDSHLAEIDEHNRSIDFYRNNIAILENQINSINAQLAVIDAQIGIVTKYQNSLKTHSVFLTTLESTTKILEPLENAASERMQLDFQLKQLDGQIEMLKQAYKELDGKLREYHRLVETGKELEKTYSNLSLIQESVSTKKGIPVIYMRSYLGRIQRLTNELLKVIYEDDLQLAPFNVTQDTFEVPYMKNGTKVPDVRFASQSEVALITMALSFALANRASGAYNILLLDEIDAGLDEKNRYAFLSMLRKQMATLDAEQVFIISHNLTQMINIPMDCIRLSDVNYNNRFHHVIYE